MVSGRIHPSLKMAAILHADVAGSTTLVQLNESVAHERITETFTTFTRIIEQYDGTVHEVRGDALVAEFPRASNAVNAALAFQALHSGNLRQIADDIKPAVRIGVSLGEVVFADSTVTGAGVVLAQRVEQLADPGGLCITSAIHEALPQRMPIEQDNLGERNVKGFDEPVRVFAVSLREGAILDAPEEKSTVKSTSVVRWLAMGLLILSAAGVVLFAWLQPWHSGHDTESAGSTVAPQNEITSTDESSTSPQQLQSDKPTIAVLPFNNLSGDPEQEYFADGITEDLTTDLSKISGLFVVARNSSFAYKGKSPDVRDVSRDLGVRYVLEGSVRRAGDQLRINAQLIDATTGGHIWAERFDGTMSDIFKLQDDVNSRIVKALEVSLTVDERERLAAVETSSPAAYDTLLRGFRQYQFFTREANVEARGFFLRAIDLDDRYARAYANVALTYGSEVNFNWTDNQEESIQLGLEYASMAMELDDTLPQIYLTRSMLYLAQRRHDAAVEAGRRTIEVHPNYADGYAALAFVMSFSGYPEEALSAIRRAKQINPQYSGIYLAVEARVLFILKRYDAAVGLIEESVERNPAFELSQLTLAAVYAKLGRFDDAAWVVEEALLIRPDITLEDERRDSNYRRPQDLDHYIEALRKAGVPER